MIKILEINYVIFLIIVISTEKIKNKIKIVRKINQYRRNTWY